MYTKGVSAALVQQIESESRTFIAELRRNDSHLDASIREFTYSSASNSGDYITFGSAVCSYVNMTLDTPSFRMYGVEFELRVGINVNGTPMYIPLGLFTAEKPVDNGETVQVTMYDRMAKFEAVYVPKIQFPADTNGLLQDICTTCGVPYVKPVKKYNLATAPEGMTCREVLTYIGELLGCFAVINREGKLEFRWYTESGVTLAPGRYWDPFNRSENDYILSRITAITGADEQGVQETVTAGSGAKGIIFENPYYTQAIINEIFSARQGFTFRPAEFTALGDPRLEPGDIITVSGRESTSYTIPVMELQLKYDGGLSMTIQAVGEEDQPDDFSARGPSTTAVERLTTRLLLAERALVQKIDASEVAADYATINSLDALSATVGNLSADHAALAELYTNHMDAAEANITELQSGYANIGVLQTDLANVKTLIFGNTAGTDAQILQITSRNATFDTAFLRQLIAENISVAELKAGTIFTDKQTIMSPDGALLIDGSVMQFKDKDNTVRIQIGKDGTGAYSFTIFNAAGDPVWYEDGVTADAIPDGLIVNSMVAEAGSSPGYNGIAASKLDINSVVGAINSSDGLRATHIYLDDHSQSLGVEFLQMQSDVTSAGANAEAAVTTANSAQAAAQNALQVLSGISTLDAMGVVLTNDAHVVHTLPDGTGGSYTNAWTQVHVYLGDTDVTSMATIKVTKSESVTGTWNAGTAVYQVSDLSEDDGYVDFDCLYGTSEHYLCSPSGKTYVLGDKYLLIDSGGSHISKRFSLSKSRDGRVGVAYTLQTSVSVITRDVTSDNAIVFSPASITASAMINDNGTISRYSGIFVVEESDGSGFVEKERSAGPEESHIYTPSASTDLKTIRISLMDPTETYTYDFQTIAVVADAEVLRQATVSNTTRVSRLEETAEGFRTSIDTLQSSVTGLTDGNLVVNWRHRDNRDGTATVQCYVYKAGEDRADDYPPYFFRYIRRTEAGEAVLGYGKTITVDLDDYMYGGTLEGQFGTYEEPYLTTRSGAYLTTRSGALLTTLKEAV